MKVYTPDAFYDDDGVLERLVAGDAIEFIAEKWRGQNTLDPSLLGDVDALLAWQMVSVDAALIARLDRCRIIVRGGVGYNNIDLAAAAARDIPVANTPDYGTCEVANHAIAMLLALDHGIIPFDRALRKSLSTGFDHRVYMEGRRIGGRALGLLGLGTIGTAVALRAKAFGMRVLVYDPYLPSGQELALGVTRLERLDELLREADVISLHAPLTPDTANIIDAAAIARMKPGAILLNTARGGLVDLDALHDGLRDGHIRAAGLDVLAVEPPAEPFPRLLQAFADNEAWLEGRLVLTPHAAWSSVESRNDTRTKSMETVRRFLIDGALRNCVNANLLAPGWRERRVDAIERTPA